ncbi:MAG TPA: hypothetical protein DEG76_02255 [Pseudohongiella sp.]|nr:hypothetical protein [Pseudohongiella sp.]HBX36180.1 hypothetical protein [Pseudohongiella sp.]|tara:strand:+ start:2027 stop:2224 length:198 start_codon:yes stop_codon:yes gene_type:complete
MLFFRVIFELPAKLKPMIKVLPSEQSFWKNARDKGGVITNELTNGIHHWVTLINQYSTNERAERF